MPSSGDIRLTSPIQGSSPSFQPSGEDGSAPLVNPSSLPIQISAPFFQSSFESEPEPFILNSIISGIFLTKTSSRFQIKFRDGRESPFNFGTYFSMEGNGGMRIKREINLGGGCRLIYILYSPPHSPPPFQATLKCYWLSFLLGSQNFVD